MAYLNFLDTVTHWDSSDTHQWVRLYTERPLLTLLLLCVADAAPSNDTVLQWASCKHKDTVKPKPVRSEFKNVQPYIYKNKHLHAQVLWAAPHNPAPAPDWHLCRLAGQRVSQSHLWREDRFLQKMRSWRVGSAASLFLADQTASNKFNKKCLNNQLVGTVTAMTLRHRDGNWTNYLPAQLLEICEQPCENWLWWPCPLLDHDPDYSFCTGWGELVCHQYTVTWTRHAHSLTKETNKKLKGKQVLRVSATFCSLVVELI